MNRSKHFKRDLRSWMQFETRARSDRGILHSMVREHRSEATKKCADCASSRGFSLIEMIIYAGILSVLTIVTVNATFSAIKSFAEFRVSRDLNSSATSLLERMTREIRAAHGINWAQSTFGSNPGRLTILTKDSAGTDTTVEFYVENGTLKIKEGGVAMGALTSSSTVVTNFIVRSLSNPKSSAVKTELGLTVARSGVSKSGNFYSTILLRGSY